jgi:hypothetical protein
MKIFAKISSREIGVSSLRLDPNNPRLRLHPGGNSEKELIERLCRLGQQSPSQVIKHLLADRGYLHNEIPVVYKAPGKSELIIIDGNRRMAALKMVCNPSLIPSTRHGLRTDCEKLRGLVPDKIRYWVTSSMSDAKRIVYRAHNEGTREWETLARYATHYDYHKEGQTISEIAEVTGSQQKDVRDEVNAWLLYEAMIRHIPEFRIEDEGITNFERVTTAYPAFPRRLGIGMSAEGVYQIPDDKDLVAIIYRVYMNSAKSPGFTRIVGNNDDARETFWNEILPNGFRPSADRDLSQSMDLDATGHRFEVNLQTKKTNANLDGDQVPKPGQGGRTKSPGADPLTSDRQILSVKKNVGKKAHAIFTEYIKISQLGDFPIASAALIRAMIETTLKHHAKRLACYEETPEQQQRHQSDALDNVANKLKRKIAGLQLAYSADLLAAIGNCNKSVLELNDVMHKDGAFSARPAVRSCLAALATAVENLVLIPDVGR